MSLGSKLISHAQASLTKSFLQLFSTLIGYSFAWYLVYKFYHISYFLTIIPMVLVSLFTVRLFIMQHDCGHGSFYDSSVLSSITGEILSVITTVPYQWWAKDHSIHHATTGCLEKRGNGDIDTLTINEYKEKGFLKRLAYDIYRNPFILLGLGPFFLLAYHRLPPFTFDKEWKKERNSVIRLNIYYTAIASIVVLKGITFQFLSVLIPVMWFAWFMGIMQFYCQHQFENAYWANENEWSYKEACLKGSSYFSMPKIMQYFTGNIGFHHIHHFNSKIPNYNLEKAHNEIMKDCPKEFSIVTEITFKDVPRLLSLRFWDEKSKKLVP